MMKPPKEISKAKIPRKTIIISYAVIYATSLPMYSLAREATTLSWVLSSLKFYHNSVLFQASPQSFHIP